jgi:hypothetical protein
MGIAGKILWDGSTVSLKSFQVIDLLASNAQYAHVFLSLLPIRSSFLKYARSHSLQTFASDVSFTKFSIFCTSHRMKTNEEEKNYDA